MILRQQLNYAAKNKTMNKENRQTAGIWAEHLGDAFVGCYGLLDDLKKDDATDSEISKIVEASNLVEQAMTLLNEVCEGKVDDKQ
jgi:hypothetical protein